MEPTMNDVAVRRGNIVIGAMLVLTGVAIVLDRAGVFHWRERWTIWPLILGGIGLAKLVQSKPGEPKQGLLFITIAVWLFLSEAGWLSFESSWPIVIIGIGLIVAFNGGIRRSRIPDPAYDPADLSRGKHHRRRDWPLSPMATLGIWIAIFVGFQVSGIRTSLSSANVGDRVVVTSVMGRAEHISRATPFHGADVTNVMGRSELDLTEATLAPGENASVQVMSAMGEVIVRAPRTWTVDTRAITAMGGVRDERGTPPQAEAGDGPAPRLVFRGLVIAGRLIITS